jgi:dipeptidyl aminopeptidase/acylaminoacyl peptidase
MISQLLRLCLLPLAGILAGCTIAPTHPSLNSAELPELLPLRKFVAGLDEQGGYALSPDGMKLRWFALSGEDMATFVREVDGGATRVFRIGRHFPIWAGDSRHLLYEDDPLGDGNTQIMLLDTQQPDAAPRSLTPWAGSKAILIDNGDARRLVFLSNRRDPALFDAYSADPASGEVTLLLQNPGDVVGLVMDFEHDIGARVRSQGDDRILQRRTGSGRWKSVYRWSQSDSVWPLRVDRAAGSVLMVSNAGRDKSALVVLSPDGRRERVLSAHPEVDLHHVVLDPDGRPVAVWYDPDLPRTVLLDPALQAQVQRALPDGVKAWRLQNSDRGSMRAVVKIFADKGTLEGLFDRRSNSFTVLADRRDDPALAALVATRPIRYQAADGSTIHGYLTLPGTPRRPLPMLVWVHGGPWQRSFWEASDLHSLAQFYANRGYAVLNVNYRGSRGYGRTHMEAAFGEFGRSLQQDIADGVDWAIAHGIADPGRVAVGGPGFGGYSTLQALMLRPDRYACGIDIVGTADMSLESWPPYWKPWAHMWQPYAGDTGATESRVLDSAASYRTGLVRAPLLVIEDAHDARVLRARGGPVPRLSLADAGQHAGRWQNRAAMYRRIEDFLAGCLGGRSDGPVLFRRW